MTNETEVLPTGSRQEKVAGRFDQLSYEPMRLLACIREVGVCKYGAKNHLGIPADDSLNHALQHIYKFLEGKPAEYGVYDGTPKEHLGHAMCRIMMALDVLLLQEKEGGNQ